MLPADQLAVGVEPGFEPVVVHRPVETAVDVVLAGPLQLHRHAVGAQRLGDRYRLDDIVRPGVGAPAEAAAGVERIDLHLLRLQPGGARRVALVDGLELVAGPDLAAVGGQPDHRVQRLHRRMGEERELVAGGDPAGRPGHRLGGVAVPARGLAGLLGELAVLRHQRLGTTLLGLALVPLDLERVAALLRRPEALGDHRHAVRHLDHLDHPGIALVAVASNDFTVAPNSGGRWSRATSMPGRLTSRVNCALPSVLPGTSTRGAW